MKSLVIVTATMESQCEDKRIWKAFQKGDREAFGILYRRYFPFLIQSSLRISSDHELVKDCIHDLFVEMWNKKINLGLPKSVRAYFYISIRRKIIRQLKRARSRAFHQDLEFLSEREVTDLDIEMKIIAEQQRWQQQHDILKVLNQLSKRQKEAVYLKYFANLSYSEIAGKMSISTDSIYNLVSKAIVTMQNEIAKNVNIG